MLNGFDRNRQEVIDQADLFLMERLAVGYTSEHAVEASHGLHPGADFLLRREDVLARFLIAELGLVSEDGSELLLKLIADVDDERWPNIVVERSVDDLKRPVGNSSAGLRPAVGGDYQPPPTCPTSPVQPGSKPRTQE